MMPPRRLVAFLLLLAGCGGNPFAVVRAEGYPFPDGFLWGVATAAHQIEGGNDKNDWWDWEQRPGAIKGGDRSGDAVGFARTFAEDAALARDLGQSAFRLSIEWSRIEPERGKRDPAQIRYYHDVLAALRRSGLRPFVTLFHFTLPRWVARQGGWESPETVADFAAFAAFCAREYGQEVDDWITLNEPNVYARAGYLVGDWPPGRKGDLSAFLAVMGRQLVGHAKAAKALKAGDTADGGTGAPCRVGIAHHVVIFDPQTVLSPLQLVAAGVEDQVFNLATIEATRTGRFVADVPGQGHVDVADPDLAGSVDFLGVNYYQRYVVSGLNEHAHLEGVPRNDLDWEIYPDGMFRWLDRLRARRLPIYVTENGTADRDDRFRDRFVVQHLMRVWAAIASGVPVKGYFHWSLMDNFEWAEGFSARFGLYRVDYGTSNTSRTLTRGGEAYRRIAKENRLPADLVRRLGS